MSQVQLTIVLEVAPAEGVTEAELQAASEALADVMLVQAEDGVYALGSPDAYDFDNPDSNVLVAQIERMEIAKVVARIA